MRWYEMAGFRRMKPVCGVKTAVAVSETAGRAMALAKQTEMH